MVANGRDPGLLKVMPGIFPVIGRSRAEAEDRFAELQALVHPEVAISHLSRLIGHDLSGFDPHGTLPDLPVSAGFISRQRLLTDKARREGLSILQLGLAMAGARGHWQIIGTPADIADAMQERFEGGAADGFNIMAPVLPGDLERFVDLVIPELQHRGLYRTAYAGATLRDHLGLPRPAAGDSFTARDWHDADAAE